MAFNIWIGNAVLAGGTEDDEGDFYADVEPLEVENPLMIIGDTNCSYRNPGYGQWHNFVEAAGLKSFFFDEFTGLMRDHPGTKALTQDHLTHVRAALEIAKRKYPNAPLHFPVKREDETIDDFEERENKHPEGSGVLIRLMWLEFWIDAALKHCEKPALRNS